MGKMVGLTITATIQRFADEICAGFRCLLWRSYDVV